MGELEKRKRFLECNLFPFNMIIMCCIVLAGAAVMRRGMTTGAQMAIIKLK